MTKNNLRQPSVVKVNRLTTVEENMIVAVIGTLNENHLAESKRVFKSLVD